MFAIFIKKGKCVNEYYSVVGFVLLPNKVQGVILCGHAIVKVVQLFFFVHSSF